MAETPESAFAATQTSPSAGGASVSDFRRLSPTALLAEADREAAEPSGEPEPPPLIGGFAVLRAQARGGLGEVFLAYDPALGRNVAVKRIRSDRRSSAELRQRFLREAAITSQLEHPGIIPIHALAADEDGRPFYVMRFIQGQTLAQAIAEHHRQPTPASLRALLQRFVSVCQTAAYAHSKGVLHRDLKPANIMLGPYGETLVLDWGLAKKVLSPEVRGRLEQDPEAVRSPDAASLAATHLCLQEPQIDSAGAAPDAKSGADAATLVAAPAFADLATPADSSLTQDGAVLGTPAYMSPEQAAGKGDELTPASDLYSLGAILYEMLAGRPPHQGGSLPELMAKVLAGKIEPPRRLRPGVSRALEAVCLRALAREPGSRYGSAAELAEEVDRWLAREPVQAFPEPWNVRLGRWLRRRRTAAAAALALLFAVTIGLGVGNFLLQRANDETSRERNAALFARDQERAAREQAEAATRAANAVTEFLVTDIFGQANPRWSKKAITLKEALDRSLPNVGRTFAEQPLVEMRIRMAAGSAYRSLSELTVADGHLRRALELARAHLAEDHSERLDVEEEFAITLGKLGKNAEASRLLQELLPRFIRVHGLEHPQTLRLRNNLGMTLTDDDRHAEAGEQFRVAIESWERNADLMRRFANGYWSLRMNFAYHLARQAKWEEALGHMDAAAAWIAKNSRPDDHRLLNLNIYRGTALMSLGRLEEAESLLRAAAAHVEQRFGPSSDMAVTINVNLGAVLLRLRKFVEADPVTKKGFELALEYESTDARMLSAAKMNRAAALAAQGKLAESAAVLKAEPKRKSGGKP